MSATDDTPSGPGSPATATPTPYQEVQSSPEFAALRGRWRRFIFTMSAVFLAWFLVYVLLAAYARDFMNTRIGDSNITVGLIMGLLQFVSTFAIATIYVRFADKHLDPEAERLRRQVEEKL
ncbi:clumping factor B [Actinomycetospora sp. NBRC 106375]|uniref:DUF485 domain-containing protein n=1 Tax=Actinomycetospora sp. NBRC 106375 TaxID=3032207 RepID=UPI0024A2B87E|nr:DUF485 domain-containing protein [Actinomycetospora sp. NBRC 106375]GLZ46503.1 clumping factor B [Actinomycetospora sp. NBRC 106375]